MLYNDFSISTWNRTNCTEFYISREIEWSLREKKASWVDKNGNNTDEISFSFNL